MNNLPKTAESYLKYCKEQKRLDAKTLKAYQIDLKQFYTYLDTINICDTSITDIEKYLADLHQNFKPKTVMNNPG